MSNLPRVHAIVAVTRREITRHWRSRIVFWVTALTALTWLSAVELRSRPVSALAVMSQMLFLAVVFLTAGVVSESLASGAAMLDRLHGVTPLETVLGSAVGGAVALAPSFLVSALVVFRYTPRSLAGPVTLMLLWIAVAALALVAVAVLLGTMLPSAGNALVLAPFVLVGVAPPSSLPLDAMPQAVASAVRGLWSILPLQFQVDAMQNARFLGGKPAWLPPVVLLLSIPLYLSLAAVTLRRLQLAARWKQ